MRQIEFGRTVLGREITLRATLFQEGLLVLLLGGSRPHIGAVSMGEAGKEIQTLVFPGHKEAVVTEAWAAELVRRGRAPVTVACGIHYDSATAEMLREILENTDAMLRLLIERLSAPESEA